jgi:hypothetical protein
LRALIENSNERQHRLDTDSQHLFLNGVSTVVEQASERGMVEIGLTGSLREVEEFGRQHVKTGLRT